MFIKLQASVNLSLNLVVFALILSTFLFNYFTFMNYSVGLFTITHPIKYEDVAEVKVFTWFSNFKELACEHSTDPGIQTVCSNITNFQVAGLLYFLLSLLAIGSIFSSCMNLLMLMAGRPNFWTKYHWPHYLNAGLLFLAGASYLLISNVDGLEHPQYRKVNLQANLGIKLLFATTFMALLTLLHYLFLKKFRNLDYLVPEREEQHRLAEVKSKQEAFAPESFEVPVRSQQEAQPGIIEVSNEELQNTKLERDDLKKKLKSLQKKLRTKETEDTDIARLRNLLENLKKENLEKTNQVEELTKDSQLDKQALKSLERNKEKLNNLLQERETQIERLRQERNNFRVLIKEKEELVETLNLQLTQTQREVVASSFDENTETLRNQRDSLSQTVEQLKASLENQKNYSNQLTEKNQDLELKVEELQVKLKHLSDNYNASKESLGEAEVKYQELQTAEAEKKDLRNNLENLTSELQLYKAEAETARQKASELKYQNETLNSELEHKTKQLKELMEELSKLKAEVTETQMLSAEIQSLEEQLKKSVSQSKSLKDSYNQAQVDWESEKADLDYKIKQKSREIEHLQSRLNSQEEESNNYLHESHEQIEKLKDELKLAKLQSEMHKEEVDRLSYLKETLRQQLFDKDTKLEELSQEEARKYLSQEKLNKILQQQNEELENNLRNSELRLEELVSEKESLRHELIEKEDELAKVSQEAQSIYRRHSQSSASMVSAELSQSMSEGSFTGQSAQELMIIESLADVDVRDNPLVNSVKSVQREASMTFSNVWKLVESLMTEKVKLDRLELPLGRQPRDMISFIFDFMELRFELKTLALRKLKGLISSLEELYKMDHLYGVVICRMLGLFHPRPFPSILCDYLLMLQELFNHYAQKSALRTSSFAEHYEIEQYGGQLSIVEVMELVMKTCARNRPAGERILNSLYKSSLDKVQMILMKVCGTMARMGKTSSYIFEVLDLDQGGSIDYHEFVDGIRLSLNIWVSQEEAEELCAYIDSDNSGLVSIEEWNQKVDFNEYADKAYSKEAMVTKAEVMGAFAQEYESEVIQDYNMLRPRIKNSLTKESFKESMIDLDSSLENKKIRQLYREAKEMEGHRKISPEVFCITALRNQIGNYGLGIFSLETMEKALTKTIDQSYSSP